MMTKIEQIWNDLENDRSFTHGLLIRRYSGNVLADVFVALKSPENFRCVAASLNNSIQINVSSFSNLRDIHVEIIPDETNTEKNYLIFKLVNFEHRDIFSVLCEDLILNISSVTNQIQLFKTLLNRFEKWKSLFDKLNSVGLTPQEQRGLYGELYFLRNLLITNSDFYKVLNSWTGPAKEIRDFQIGNTAVEVKTTHGNNHQKIHISSERQLDLCNLQNLYLYHISLDVRHQDGESLNQLVDSISELLNADYIVINSFNNKLLEAGYFNHHRDIYKDIGYFIRQDAFYKIEGEFPRIEENEIKRGVGDVKYSIIVDNCQNYLTTETEVLTNLN